MILDHAPQSIFFSLTENGNKCKQWKFNNALLKDDAFRSLTEKRIQEFILINVDSVSSIQTVWEACKATCRGWIISYASAK